MYCSRLCDYRWLHCSNSRLGEQVVSLLQFVSYCSHLILFNETVLEYKRKDICVHTLQLCFFLPFSRSRRQCLLLGFLWKFQWDWVLSVAQECRYVLVFICVSLWTRRLREKRKNICYLGSKVFCRFWSWRDTRFIVPSYRWYDVSSSWYNLIFFGSYRTAWDCLDFVYFD